MLNKVKVLNAIKYRIVAVIIKELQKGDIFYKVKKKEKNEN